MIMKNYIMIIIHHHYHNHYWWLYLDCLDWKVGEWWALPLHEHCSEIFLDCHAALRTGHVMDWWRRETTLPETQIVKCQSWMRRPEPLEILIKTDEVRKKVLYFVKVTFTFVQRWILRNVCLWFVSMNRHRSELSDGSSFWALNSVDAVTRRRALNMWCVDALKEWGWYWRQWGAGVLTMVRWNKNNQSESVISLYQPIRI